MSMRVVDSPISVSEAMEHLRRRTDGSVVDCGDCTACCKIYPDIEGIEMAPGTKICPKLCSSGCSIYKKRPQTCKRYSCFVFTLSGIGSKPLIENNGKVFNFAIRTPKDVALTALLYCFGAKICQRLGDDIKADSTASVVALLSYLMAEDTDILQRIANEIPIINEMAYFPLASMFSTRMMFTMGHLVLSQDIESKIDAYIDRETIIDGNHIKFANPRYDENGEKNS